MGAVEVSLSIELQFHVLTESTESSDEGKQQLAGLCLVANAIVLIVQPFMHRPPKASKPFVSEHEKELGGMVLDASQI